MSLEAIISSVAGNPDEVLARLGGSLVDSGAIDRRSLDRARRVAAETAGRLDHVLTQLGLVSERGLAEALAQLIRAPLVGPADYPDAPLFADRLKVKFLRQVRAMPIAAAEDRATLAMADPLDVFARDAVAAALGYPVRVAVAIPIELEAAFDRLYAAANEDGEDAALLDGVMPDAEPAEEDAERLKDLASEAPVIRLVNQLIARAVETHASDVHLEPFPDRQRQNDDALYRPAQAEHGGAQCRDRGGPYRVPARGHQPDPGEAADRAQFRQPAALDPAAGSRRHHDRRDPRSRNRADRRAGGADRPSRAVDRAYQLGRGNDDPAARYGARGLPDDRDPEGGAGAAAGPAAVRRMQGGRTGAGRADRAVRHDAGG